MALPRYMAAAQLDDPERLAMLADELVSFGDADGSVLLLHVGQSDSSTNTIRRSLEQRGRRTTRLSITDRPAAQADATLSRLATAAGVWLVVDNLLHAFVTLFATQTAWSLRSKARRGFPVIGVGSGALSLGGLVLASRICPSGHYDLVGGLGWASRVLVNTDAVGASGDRDVTTATVRSLPGLLGLDLGSGGAVRTLGWQIESIGTDTVWLLGDNGDGVVETLALHPGESTRLAPPPFAPFDRDLLNSEMLRAPSAEHAEAPTSDVPLHGAMLAGSVVGEYQTEQNEHAEAGGDRFCPLCKQVHATASVPLAA